MASFEEILNKPASEIKAPPAYPTGWYHCYVDGPPEQGKSSQKQTDFFKFKFKIIAPADGVDAKAAAEMQLPGKYIYSDYYVTDAAVYHLKEMLVNDLGIDEEGKSLTQLLAEAPSKQVMVQLKHDVSPDGRRVFHKVNSTKPVV